MFDFARFQRPSRYIDSEINVIRKQAPLSVALAFPDVYEVGMSHLGLKVLYHIINSLEYAVAERAFHPWLDMEDALRAAGEPLRSLESGRALGEFDVLGFSLQYELSYTSVLNMLALAGIPQRAGQRDEGHPLIIAGGPCTSNPLPMAAFIDAFVVGDAEELIVELLDTVHMWKSGGNTRKEELLKALSRIQGVYVPSVHGLEAASVRRRLVSSLEEAPYPTAPIVPYAQIVHDRVNIEVSRGCAMGCRFCQAGVIYRPLRERSPGKALDLAERSVIATGYEEVSFTSLSAGDYSCLLELLKSFNRKFASRRVSVSLPSLRVKAVNAEVLQEIRAVRKTGFTIAPEAATDRLRCAINKDFSEEDYERAVETLFKEGWQNLKLYYMIGLPTELDEDIEAIPAMVRKAVKAARRHSSRFVNVSVSISPFVPKAHTPFQWCGQQPIEYLREKREHIISSLRKINFKGHDERTSMLEAAFARGDQSLAGLVEAAAAEGARLDGWSEAFEFDKWQRAMDRSGIDASSYASRSYDLEAFLPWEVVDTGVRKGHLSREYSRALSVERTKGCTERCSACGLKCTDEGEALTPAFAPAEATRSPVNGLQRRPALPRNPIRARVEFTKTGRLRFLSHRELMTHITRALHRAGVSMEYSKGFHPSPRIAFGPPLSVGVAGLGEYFDMEIMPLMALGLIRETLNRELGDGVEVLRIAPLGQGEPSLQAFVSKYVYEFAHPITEELREFMAAPSFTVRREKGSADIRPAVESAAEKPGGNVLLTLLDKPDVKVRLDEIAENLFKKPLSDLEITRTALYGLRNGRWERPLAVKGQV